MVRSARGPKREPGAVGDAEIHRHADDRDLQVAEIRLVVVDRQVGRREEGRDAGIGREPGAALGEDLVGDLAEARVEHLAAMAFAVFPAQGLKPVAIETHVVVPALVSPCRSADRLMRQTLAEINRTARPVQLFRSTQHPQQGFACPRASPGEERARKRLSTVTLMPWPKHNGGSKAPHFAF